MADKLFNLGDVVITPGCQLAFAREYEFFTPFNKALQKFLSRYQSGDWGEMDDEDCHTNDEAVKHGYRIMAAYRLPESDVKFWIITEWDRSVTTFLLPEEY